MRARSMVGLLLVSGLVAGTGVGVPAGAIRKVTTAAAAPAPCRGSELAGVYVRTGAGLGNIGTVVAVTNVASTACRLEGYPVLRGLRAGRWHLLRVNHGTYFGDLTPTLLEPREGGAMLLGTGDACRALNQPSQRTFRHVAAANTYAELTVTLPDHRGAFHVFGLNLDVACGLDESQVGWRVGFTFLI